MKGNIKVRLVSAILTVVLPGVLSAASIVNGSFESPTVPAGSFSNFNTGSTAITGWTVVGPQVSVVSGTFTQNGYNFPAESGSQWLDLTGNGANSDSNGVMQTVSTTPGTSYTLSYFVGNVVNPGGDFGTTSTVDVYVNGALVQTAVNSGGGNTLTWEQFQTTFVANSSSTVIAFLNGDPASDDSNGLDNVVLAGTMNSVPEPSSVPFLAVIAFVAVGRLLWPKLRTLNGH